MVESSCLLGYLLLFLREDVSCRKLHVTQRSSDLLYSHKLSMSLVSILSTFFPSTPLINKTSHSLLSIDLYIFLFHDTSLYRKLMTRCISQSPDTWDNCPYCRQLYTPEQAILLRTKILAYSNIRAESFYEPTLVFLHFCQL